MSEKRFQRMIRRKTRTSITIVLLVLGVVVLGGYAVLRVFEFALGSFPVVFTIYLILSVVNVLTVWAFRGIGRQDDFYSIVREYSVSQLERFRSEIDNAIEELKAEEMISQSSLNAGLRVARQEAGEAK